MTVHSLPEGLRIPTFADVRTAQSRIAGQAHRTPALTSRTADQRTGASLFFKAENLQRGGAFKFRGAYNAIAALDGDARSRGVLAFSSGNHAQAVAYAARLLGVASTIVMPTDSSNQSLPAARTVSQTSSTAPAPEPPAIDDTTMTTGSDAVGLS